MSASGSFPAIGTTATVVVQRADALGAAVDTLGDELRRLDLACSRFRDDSELAGVNARAGERVEVGDLFLSLLTAAVDAARATNGLVDPALGAHVRNTGYDRTFSLVRERDRWSIAPLAPHRDRWRQIEIDAATRTVRVPRGCELDLGATAKAFAADRAAVRIAAEIDGPALVSLGGDVATAGPPPEGGWSIRIADDHRTPLDAPGPCVAIGSGGLATSSTAVRRWPTETGEAHHLLDPGTGLPARTPWRTVSVAADTCFQANVASTAAIVLGERAVPWLAERGLAARLVAEDGEVVRVCGWPADELEAAA